MALENIQTHISQLEKVQKIDGNNADQINQILAQTDSELAQLKSVQEKSQAYSLILPQVQKLKDSIKPAQKTDPKVSQLSDRLIAFEAKIGERNNVMADINKKAGNVEEIRNENWVRKKLRGLANVVVTPLGIDNFDPKSWVPDWENHKNNNPIQNFSMGIIDYFIDMPAVVEDIIKNPELLKSLGQALIKMFSIAGIKELFEQFMADVKGDAYHKGRAFIDLLMNIAGFGAALKGAGGLAKAIAKMENISIKMGNISITKSKEVIFEARRIAAREVSNPPAFSDPKIKREELAKKLDKPGDVLLKTGDKVLSVPKAVVGAPKAGLKLATNAIDAKFPQLRQFFETNAKIQSVISMKNASVGKIKQFLSPRKELNGSQEIIDEIIQLENKIKIDPDISQQQKLIDSILKKINEKNLNFDNRLKTELLTGFPAYVKTSNAKKILDILTNKNLLQDFENITTKIKSGTATNDEILNFIRNNNGFPVKYFGKNHTTLTASDIPQLKKGLLLTGRLYEKFASNTSLIDDFNDLKILEFGRKKALKNKRNILDAPNNLKEKIGRLGEIIDEKLAGTNMNGKELVVKLKNGGEVVFDVTDGPNGKLLTIRGAKGNGAIDFKNKKQWIYSATDGGFKNGNDIVKLDEVQEIFAQKKRISQPIIDQKPLVDNRNVQRQAAKKVAEANANSGGINGTGRIRNAITGQAEVVAKGLSIMQKQADSLSKFFATYPIGKEFEIFSAGKKIAIKRLKNENGLPTFEVNGKKGQIIVDFVKASDGLPTRWQNGKFKGEIELKLPGGEKIDINAGSLIWKQNGVDYVKLARIKNNALIGAGVATWTINIMNRNFDTQMKKELEASINSYENGLATGVFSSNLDQNSSSDGTDSQNSSSNPQNSINSKDDQNTSDSENNQSSTSQDSTSQDSTSVTLDNSQDGNSGGEDSDSQDTNTNSESGNDEQTISDGKQSGDSEKENNSDTSKKTFDIDSQNFFSMQHLQTSQRDEFLKLLGIDISSTKNILAHAKSSVRLIPHNINGVNYDQEKFVKETNQLFNAQSEKFVEFESQGNEKKLFLQSGGGVHIDMDQIFVVQKGEKTYYLAPVSQSSKMRGNFVILGEQSGENFSNSLIFSDKPNQTQDISDSTEKLDTPDPKSKAEQTSTKPDTQTETDPPSSEPDTQAKQPQNTQQPNPKPSEESKPKETDKTNSIGLELPTKDADVYEIMEIGEHYKRSLNFKTKFSLNIYTKDGKFKQTNENFGDLERKSYFSEDDDGNLMISQGSDIQVSIMELKKSSVGDTTYYFAPIKGTNTPLDGKYIKAASQKKGEITEFLLEAQN